MHMLYQLGRTPASGDSERGLKKYEKAAIRIYKCKDHYGHDANGPKPSVVGGLTAIRISYIEIQSPIIRREVGSILTEGRLETLSTETIKISRPFKELYLAHGRIPDILKRQEPGTKEKEHMQVLVDVLEEIFAEVARSFVTARGKKDHLQLSLDKFPQEHYRIFERNGSRSAI